MKGVLFKRKIRDGTCGEDYSSVKVSSDKNPPHRFLVSFRDDTHIGEYLHDHFWSGSPCLKLDDHDVTPIIFSGNIDSARLCLAFLTFVDNPESWLKLLDVATQRQLQISLESKCYFLGLGNL